MRNPYKNFKYEDFLKRPSAIHRELISLICKKLTDQFKINYFLYQRRYKKFILLELTNAHQWGIRYCTEYIFYDSFRNIDLDNSNYYIWGVDAQCKKEEDMHAEREEIYKIPPGVTFMVNSGKFIDTYSFSGSLSQSDNVYSLLKIKDDLIKFGDEFVKQINFILTEKKITNDTFKANTIEKKYNKDDFKPKEIKILAMLAADYETPKIAELIHVEVKSVQKIINTLREKMDCETRTGLIAKAICENIISDLPDMITSPIILL